MKQIVAALLIFLLFGCGSSRPVVALQSPEFVQVNVWQYQGQSGCTNLHGWGEKVVSKHLVIGAERGRHTSGPGYDLWYIQMAPGQPDFWTDSTGMTLLTGGKR